MKIPLIGLAISLVVSAAAADVSSNTDSGLLAQVSPPWLADVPIPPESAVVREYPKDENIKVQALPGPYKLDLTKYPPPLKTPSGDHPEVQKVMSMLDWSKVPQIEKRTIKTWAVDTSGYDARSDPDCWWSASTCKKPKLSYLPEDIYMCPTPGDWGLNYDDGPLRIWSFNETLKQWEEPRFYNFLVEHGKQKATLFFIGSNVISFPEAAQRALNDGHTICAHTWSHQQMTSLSNQEIVAEFYWTSKAIKEVLGITPKCWRPPYGDVDDRVRAIAWLMGMRTIHWDQDSNDWNMYGTPARGKVPPEEIDKRFAGWIQQRLSNMDNEHGHITLEHENSNSTVAMAEKWLPKLQETFRVLPIHKCINDPYPYWEKSWAYPTLDNEHPPLNPEGSTGGSGGSSGSSSSSSSSSKSSSSASKASSSTVVLSFFSLILLACNILLQ
ncbi:hypothetical protein VTP01DRAFT_9585 [Rhizomucor pusillus]|uniref:uncharacterized protein n=1 Tax=Rhizomucor pusillus TaxID=4840 RepID=UPI0037446A96